MLRDDAVFDISFRQLGQSGFMALSKFFGCKILRLSEQFPRTAQKCEQAGFDLGNGINGDPVTASGFPIRKDRSGNRYRAGPSPAGAAHTG